VFFVLFLNRFAVYSQLLCYMSLHSLWLTKVWV